MFKAFKPSGMEKIARVMGYQGNMQGFQDYVSQDPMRQQQMQNYTNQAMQMARGGVARKMQTGGLALGAAVMPNYYNPQTGQTYLNKQAAPDPSVLQSYNLPSGPGAGGNMTAEQLQQAKTGTTTTQAGPQQYQPPAPNITDGRYRGLGNINSLNVQKSISPQQLGPDLPEQQLNPPSMNIGVLGGPGTGGFSGSLFVPDTSRPKSEQQMQAEWQKLVASAKKSRAEGFMGQVVLPGEGSYEDWANANKYEMMRNPDAPNSLYADFDMTGIRDPRMSISADGTPAIGDYSIDQMYNPALPAGGVTVAATTPVDPSQDVAAGTGQLTGQVAVPTAMASTAQAGPVNQTQANTMQAAQAAPAVDSAMNATQAAQADPSDPRSQVTAAQQTASSVGNLQAAQGNAVLINNPVQRQIQSGEIITGTGVDAQAAAQLTAQTQAAAATANPSQQAMVQDQLSGLMNQFQGGATPAWAAGAMRNATAQMAARGLGASSLAGQALVQAAMESAMPIAQADAATISKFESQNLSNRQQSAMLAAEQRARFMGQEFDQAFQVKVQNASRIADIANQNFTAEQQVQLENSRAANTMNLANLSNTQALIMSEAAALAQLDTANLNNRQQAAVQNAQNFLQYDMANLSNRQQTDLFKAQQRVQSLFTDQAATNAAAQFNASSQNQTDQFFANLSSQVSQFNATQQNAQSQFNAGQANTVNRFNAELNNQRDQFNAQNQLVIAQSNAQWRRQIATADTAAVNRANELNANAILDISKQAYDNLWSYYSDTMEWAWTSAENELDRITTIATAQLDADASKQAADAAASSAAGSAIGNLVGSLGSAWIKSKFGVFGS